VRILGVRFYSAETAHTGRGCPCADWAASWLDSLSAALPASARGRIVLDVEMAHPSGTGSGGRLVPLRIEATAHGAAGARTAARTEADILPVPGLMPARSTAAMTNLAGHDAADPPDTSLITEAPCVEASPEQELSSLAALLTGNGEGMTATVRDHLAVMIEEFEPDIVLGYRDGSVLAYEALALAGLRVPLFVSVGSPLAAPQVFSALSPVPVHAKGQWPNAAEHWIDIYDPRDPFAARRPFINLFDGPVADRPVDLGQGISTPEQAYLSCQTLGAVLEDHFGRWRTDVNLIADLRRVLTLICADQRNIHALLFDMDYPMARLTSDFRGADETWGEVLNELSFGAVKGGVERLLEQAGQRYPGNQELRRLRRYCNRPSARY
jgi:hypothetical protein